MIYSPSGRGVSDCGGAGQLPGKWIEIPDETDGTWKEIRNVLAPSPPPEAEEHAIHDYDRTCPSAAKVWIDFEIFIEGHFKAYSISFANRCNLPPC
ncbi:antirestriction protein ArdA [Coraliomargarita sp. SDUM461004]|uniref:Antirestriction protein ArdA n=1 Tax=Thalassobacterium sedimentorum TaxID=3041258 RepID=A0ABU1ALL9_9BACT|nr:antirestriction protein ArdA [Coraliomargarita sp. SDUM461004]MDQ8195691.1 antirestriction protein ArdA [Coraliomargarita sp. SDUM461004]